MECLSKAKSVKSLSITFNINNLDCLRHNKYLLCCLHGLSTKWTSKITFCWVVSLIIGSLAFVKHEELPTILTTYQMVTWVKRNVRWRASTNRTIIRIAVFSTTGTHSDVLFLIAGFILLFIVLRLGNLADG